uniref:Uncharacterized protein n=1 Tax=Brugia timori TaxID=42155 RepID=A0A0R3QN79_9BILA
MKVSFRKKQYFKNGWLEGLLKSISLTSHTGTKLHSIEAGYEEEINHNGSDKIGNTLNGAILHKDDRGESIRQDRSHEIAAKMVNVQLYQKEGTVKERKLESSPLNSIYNANEGATFSFIISVAVSCHRKDTQEKSIIQFIIVALLRESDEHWRQYEED